MFARFKRRQERQGIATLRDRKWLVIAAHNGKFILIYFDKQKQRLSRVWLATAKLLIQLNN